MCVIELDQVTKSLGNQLLFDQASLKIHPGDRLAVIGPNGSGKSVLFKLILGLVKPDSGRISIHTERKKVGPIFGAIVDRPGFRPDVSGFANLKELAEINRTIKDSQIKEAMERVGLEPNNETLVQNYSLGMKQKLSLAQAFMEEQKILLLDEPFNGLDKESVNTVRNLLLDLNAEGRTLVFTSHNEHDVAAISTRRVEIEKSKIKELET